jgi:DNA-binding response OmpR family regulator
MPSTNMMDSDYETRTVILMTGNPEETEQLKQAVVEFGHSSVHVNNSADLKLSLHQENAMAAVLDFSLDPVSIANLRTCINVRPGLPFLAVVPEDRRDIAVEALRLGAHAFIRRPLNGEEVIFSLGNLLASVAERYDATRSYSDKRVIEIGNDFDLVTPLAKSLVDTTLPPIDPRRNHIILGLVELLNNAIEHGNLEIDYEEKHKALTGSYFYRLAIEKSKSEPWVSRRVRVEISMDQSTGFITYSVADEGNGFDWRELPDPLQGEAMQARHGRGVLMARHSFDSLEYNDKGNVVTARVSIRPEGGRI